MATGLQNNNLTGVALITNTGGLTATPYNFTTLYNYSTQFMPNLKHELFFANGSGSITGLLELIGQTDNYDSDMVKWGEMGRLHGRMNGVTISSNIFTTPTAHNLREKQTILIVDSTGKEEFATVSAVSSSTVFTALSRTGASFSLTGPLTISEDFSNSFPKGSESFANGRKWNPDIKDNFTHIIKETYETANSDRVHATWIDTPNGPMWYSKEIERTFTLFDNIVDLTHLFNIRNTSSAAAVAGFEPGMKGIVQQIENGGNLFNGYITAIGDLEKIALRVVQQNPNVSEVLVPCDMTQMNYLNAIASTASASMVGGSTFGTFVNQEEMYLKLDFTKIKVSGITFHFKHFRLLDDPTIYAFNQSGISFLVIPWAMKQVEMDGKMAQKPYLDILYRNGNGINRRREIQLFGPGGTPITKDVSRWQILSETTNRLLGASSWFVGRKLNNFYTVG